MAAGQDRPSRPGTAADTLNLSYPHAANPYFITEPNVEAALAVLNKAIVGLETKGDTPVKPSKPGNSNTVVGENTLKPSGTSTPNTGDDTNLMLWVFLLGIAGTGMFFVRKKKEEMYIASTSSCVANSLFMILLWQY